MSKVNFAVLGLGRFGRNVALTLEQLGYNVLGVDKDENIAAEMADSLTQVVSFDIRDAHSLKEVGISNFDAAVIASTNLESSLMATMLCKEFGVSEIVVKASDERHAEMAKRLGATKIIFPERDTARRVARSLILGNAAEFMDIGDSMGILSMSVPRQLVGSNLIEMNLRAKFNVNVVAIKNGNEMMIPPPPRRNFNADDKIFIIGTSDMLAKFERTMNR